MDLNKFKEDGDVIKPFVERLLVRLREKHPDVTLDDVGIQIHVNVGRRTGNPTFHEIYRMLREMEKEGVIL